MNLEVDNLLIQVLRDYLHGENTLDLKQVNWNELYRLSNAHQISGIVCVQCKSFIPDSILPLFEQARALAVYDYANREEATKDIWRAMQDLPVFMVKGMVIARYYPIPALRTMGDCDIVVSPNYFSQVLEIVKEMEMDSIIDADEHTFVCEKNGMEFEIHDTLTKDYEYASSKQTEFFNNFSDYVNDHKLDWSFHFLFLLAHLRKHLVREGAGLRQFMDLAVVIKNVQGLRWEWMEEILLEINMQKFAHVCYALIEEWFGIAAPVRYEKLDKEFLEQITEKILANGVFGKDDEGNKNNVVYQELTNGKAPLGMKRAELLMKNLFPSYEKMVHYPKCGFLKGKPFLLPVAWMRRFLYMITDRRPIQRKQTLHNNFMTNEELKRKESFYEKMGL